MSYQSQKYRILIAEDDPDDALMLKDAFSETSDHELTFLSNGKALVEQLLKLKEKNEFPHLIIVDLNMPILDGRSVIKLLRDDPSIIDIPLVVLSTTKNMEDVAAVKALGADDFFTKPASFSDLVAITKSLTKKWLDLSN